MLSQLTECAFRIQNMRKQIEPHEYDRSICRVQNALTSSSPAESRNTLTSINEKLISSLGKETAYKALQNSGLNCDAMNLETHTTNDTSPGSDAAVRRLTLLSRTSSDLKLPNTAAAETEAKFDPIVNLVVFADVCHVSVLAPSLDSSAQVAPIEPVSVHPPHLNREVCGKVEAFRILKDFEQVSSSSTTPKRGISGVDLIVLLESDTTFVVLDIWGALESMKTSIHVNYTPTDTENADINRETRQQSCSLILSDPSKSALGKRRREEAVLETGTNNLDSTAYQQLETASMTPSNSDAASIIMRSQTTSTSSMSGSSRSHLIGLRIPFPNEKASLPGASDSKWKLNLGVTTSV